MNRRNFIFGAPAILAGSVRAQSAQTDVALILADDVSSSMSNERFALQIEGIRKALTSPRFISSVSQGPNRNMYISYMQWAGVHSQEDLGWHKVANANDLYELTLKIKAFGRQAFGSTCITNALTRAGELFDTLPVTAAKLVVDVSGDGTENQFTYVEVANARDELLDRGVTINGLPIQDTSVDDSYFDELVEYYQSYIIGGPGRFYIPVTKDDDYANCLLRKLITEVS